VRWALLLGVLTAGLVLGGAVGATIVLASTDPTQSEEYRALEQDYAGRQDRVNELSDLAQEAQESARVARDEAAQAQADLDSRAAELDQREAELVAREQAVTETENRIAANSVPSGTWTVGVDIEPGTYRTAEPVGADCYWEITTSGTNGSDIIENDIPGGGIPTVTLSAGQDFTHNRCGTFVKQ
jgi:hypothetical protein